ncbi:MAG TPA: hypothetical protein VLC92_14220 [Rhodocyclaceae bacterium]|nr:hypothetical protein [Rhodocyclaceae bacterium]
MLSQRGFAVPTLGYLPPRLQPSCKLFINIRNLVIKLVLYSISGSLLSWGQVAASKDFISEENADKLVRLCRQEMNNLKVVCIRGKDWGSYSHPDDDVQQNNEYLQYKKLISDNNISALQELSIPAKNSGSTVKIFLNIFTEYYPYTNNPVTYANISLAVHPNRMILAKDGFYRTPSEDEEMRAEIENEFLRLPLMKVSSSDGKNYLRKLELEAKLQQQQREARQVADREKSKPTCSTVVVNGIVSAGSSQLLEAAYAAKDIEDSVARNPIICRGGVAGCIGVSYQRNNVGQIIDWDPRYFVLNLPIEFDQGRRNINVFARRANAKCAK